MSRGIAQTHLDRARVLEANGRWTDAASEYLQAIDLGARSAWVFFRLGVLGYHLRQYEQAIQYFEKGLELSPQDASAYADLGKLYEKLHRWEEALTVLDRALALDPSLVKATRRKQRVSQQWERYRRQGKRLLNLPSVDASAPLHWRTHDTVTFGPFLVQFLRAAEGDAVATVHKILMQSYRQIGCDLGHYPSEVLIIIYSDGADYMAACEEAGIRTPFWSVGVYDGHTIRVQTRGDNDAYAGLLWESLAHEYTHLVVRRLTKDHCPAWLNEGLAEYESRELLPWQDTWLVNALKERRGIPLKRLEASFGWLPEDTGPLAYLQACSVVQFIVETYGMSRIRQLLHSLKQGNVVDEALRRALGFNYLVLESRWLQAVIGAASSEEQGTTGQRC